jgi:hypothetical protein
VRVTVDEISLRGAVVETLVRGEDVNDLFALLRYTAPPAFVGAPLHRHAVTAEVFHVLDGEVTVELDGKVSVLSAGDTATVPIGQCMASATPLTDRRRSWSWPLRRDSSASCASLQP